MEARAAHDENLFLPPLPTTGLSGPVTTDIVSMADQADGGAAGTGAAPAGTVMRGLAGVIGLFFADSAFRLA
ncbi:hypothetical protein D9R08_02700 [Rhodophyticola porphyridii]|uniref:Uncharacterized protein n=1 Tax=Rhodophyticola porphyridii TaxID=1852017 RepID=A0A3L9Y543_9RHOB|nr:hypothetical protein D9R08_02700 [Rhodophyticola porphyridii]